MSYMTWRQKDLCRNGRRMDFALTVVGLAGIYEVCHPN